MISPVIFTTLIAILFVFPAPSPVHAAETEYRVAPIVVSASASFDSLGEDRYIPQKKLKFERSRNGTLDVLDKSIAFPSYQLGYPGGSMGSALGGLSIDDAQYSTLGVPLNLPQGGGPDLSIFPSFLWSGASYSSSPRLAGYSPQGVSGSVQFDLWTRTAVREFKSSTDLNRVTLNADRNLQNISVATKKQTASLLAGYNTGRQKGPVASLSLYAIKKPRHQILFHLLGSEQDSDNPGTKNSPTPNDRKKLWRVIPVIESHQEFSDSDDPITWESTFSADLQNLKYEGSFPSNDRTQQYGIENAIHYRKTTLALTGRYVDHQTSGYGRSEDWPLIGNLSQDFEFENDWTMQVAAGGNYLESIGFAPSARAAFKKLLPKNADDSGALFFEIHSINQMPTLTNRYYVYLGFQGNPNLNPARVNALLSGYEFKKANVESTSLLKVEFRNNIQVQGPLNATTNTMINQGNAWLVSIQEDLSVKPMEFMTQKISATLTASQVSDTKRSYPDLPALAAVQNGIYSFTDAFDLRHTFRYLGPSKTSTGVNHPDYFLADVAADYEIKKDVVATLGCDNVFDSRAEVVLNYPLPGRMVYLNLQMTF
jgi:outer membrane receptor protein involved in Fe transport